MLGLKVPCKKANRKETISPIPTLNWANVATFTVYIEVGLLLRAHYCGQLFTPLSNSA